MINNGDILINPFLNFMLETNIMDSDVYTYEKYKIFEENFEKQIYLDKKLEYILIGKQNLYNKALEQQIYNKYKHICYLNENLLPHFPDKSIDVILNDSTLSNNIKLQNTSNSNQQYWKCRISKLIYLQYQ